MAHRYALMLCVALSCARTPETGTTTPGETSSVPQPAVQTASVGPSQGSVELWGGTPADLSNVVYQGQDKTVTLERRRDPAGVWFHGQEGNHRFVSISPMGKIVGQLAPLVARQRIGEVPPARLAAFGLSSPSDKLTIVIAGATQVLHLGGPAPDREHVYVRWAQDELVYVIDRSIVRDFRGGMMRLSERRQHAWASDEIERVAVLAGDHRYEAVRSGTPGRRFWAAEATPNVQDETLAHWLAKIDRLRPVRFAALPSDAEKIVRVELAKADSAIGFVELHYAASSDSYHLRTEHLRLAAEVAKGLAEEIRDDLGSLLP